MYVSVCVPDVEVVDAQYRAARHSPAVVAGFAQLPRTEHTGVRLGLSMEYVWVYGYILGCLSVLEFTSIFLVTYLSMYECMYE